jgi:hypothetical protein
MAYIRYMKLDLFFFFSILRSPYLLDFKALAASLCKFEPRDAVCEWDFCSVSVSDHFQLSAYCSSEQ